MFLVEFDVVEYFAGSFVYVSQAHSLLSFFIIAYLLNKNQLFVCLYLLNSNHVSNN